MKNKLIKLGVVIYGNPGQAQANQRQLLDLKRELKNFRIKAYDFGRTGADELLKDFKRKQVGVVLKNAYGRGNEADIESFLELYNIPYFGSGPLATFLGTNKFLSKTFFRQCHLPVAKDIFIDKVLWTNSRATILKAVSRIGYPCIIKDVAGTDSRGLFIAKSQKNCIKIVNKHIGTVSAMIAEQYINKTYEITCLVVGNREPKIFDPVGVLGDLLSKKIKDGKAAILKEFPAHLNPKIIKKVKQISKIAHQALGCRTFSQSNILIKGNKLFLIEVDVHPGFSAASVATASAKFQGQNLNNLFLGFYRSLNRK